jgi:tetratricopeptide (TPR) repeat protein
MSLKDIENLKERIEKDPNSKLFVPLAEEYRKEGMLDEAVEVLIKGIEKQPDYMSARVSLGKIYIEKGMLEEARSEFEQVISAIPDNLFAQKKLAEIYRDTGERDLSIKSFRRVLKLNPMDEDALSQLNDIENIDVSKEPSEEVIPQENPVTEQIPETEEEISSEATGLPHEGTAMQDTAAEPLAVTEELSSLPEAEDRVTPAEDELTEMQDYVYKDDDAPVVLSEDSLTGADDTEIVQETIELPDEEEISFQDLDETVGTGEAVLEEASEVEAEDEVVVLSEDNAGVEDNAGMAEDVISLPDETEILYENINDTVETSAAEQQDTSMFTAEPPQDDLFMADSSAGVYESVNEDSFFEEADKCIAKGEYVEAINLYNRMLASNPNDTQVLQRAEDLKSLLKLLGKDKEILISKLSIFLERIQQRRGEFYRSP